MASETYPATNKQDKDSEQHNQYSSNLIRISTTMNDDEYDDNERLARSRERNREHARRTRLRKKAQLQLLQKRVKELQTEGRVLKQSIEQCSIASILIGLSSGNSQETKESSTDTLKNIRNLSDDDLPVYGKANNKKRKRLPSEGSDLTIKINGINTIIGGGGKTHINWKTGVYSDENGIQKQLSPNELETLRRERNRMHAKMTRDRKKCFISSVEKTIAQLEEDNRQMKEQLLRQNASPASGAAPVTTAPAPSIFSLPPQAFAAAAQAAAATTYSVDINAAAVTAAVIAAQQLELSVLAMQQPIVPQIFSPKPESFFINSNNMNAGREKSVSSGVTNEKQSQDSSMLFSVVA